MNFDAFIKDIQDNHWNVHGVEIYEDGRYGLGAGKDRSGTDNPRLSPIRNHTADAGGTDCSISGNNDTKIVHHVSRWFSFSACCSITAASMMADGSSPKNMSKWRPAFSR